MYGLHTEQVWNGSEEGASHVVGGEGGFQVNTFEQVKGGPNGHMAITLCGQTGTQTRMTESFTIIYTELMSRSKSMPLGTLAALSAREPNALEALGVRPRLRSRPGPRFARNPGFPEDRSWSSSLV